MKGIVLFSENNESAILTDEGEVIKIKGSYNVGKRINFKKPDKRSGILKKVSIILGTAAAFTMITTLGLYFIGKNSGDDSKSSASSSALSIEDEDTPQPGSPDGANDLFDKNNEDSSLGEADISTEGNSSNIPEMPPAGNDESAPGDIPEGAPTADPGNGQQPQNTAPPDNQQQGAPEQTQSDNT